MHNSLLMRDGIIFEVMESGNHGATVRLWGILKDPDEPTSLKKMNGTPYRMSFHQYVWWSGEREEVIEVDDAIMKLSDAIASYESRKEN